MSNDITAYDPYFYANNALSVMEKALGMAGRVHRGYDEERRSFEKGSTIKIRRPGTFIAQDAPSTAQDIKASDLELTLTYWKEVKFTLTDKDLTLSDDRIISDHIRPAAYALADDMDQRLAALAFQCPWYYDLASTTAITDLTGPYKAMFNNNVPMGDASMLHYMINGDLQYGLQNLAAFNTASGGGDQAMQTQMRGTLGTKFGYEIFANQNVQSKLAGTISDVAGAVKTEATQGATSLTIKSLGADGESVKIGDTFVIAGNTQRYAITADASVASNEMTVSFTPGLAATAAVNAVVTLETDAHAANLAFHRNFAALATAPLTTMVSDFGVKVASVTDEKSQLAMRSRIFALPDASKVVVALDWLFGFKVLDPNLAVRCRG